MNDISREEFETAMMLLNDVREKLAAVILSIAALGEIFNPTPPPLGISAQETIQTKDVNA